MVKSRKPTWRTVGAAVVAPAAGFVVVLLLFPAYGIDTDPPQCFSTFDYSVPCGVGLSFSLGLIVTVAAWLGLHFLSRPR